MDYAVIILYRRHFVEQKVLINMLPLNALKEMNISSSNGHNFYASDVSFLAKNRQNFYKSNFTSNEGTLLDSLEKPATTVHT